MMRCALRVVHNGWKNLFVHKPGSFGVCGYATKKLRELQDIEIKTITEDMFEEALDLLWAEFMTANPLSTSMGVKRGYIMDNFVYKPEMRRGESFAAVDSAGNIVSILLGKVLRKDDELDRCMATSRMVSQARNMALWITGSNRNTWMREALGEKLGHEPWDVLDMMNLERMYYIDMATVRKDLRCRGIGGLSRAAMLGKVSSEFDCHTAYTLATNMYAQKTARHYPNYQLLSEVRYAELVDEKGKPVFSDVGPHVSAQVVITGLPAPGVLKAPAPSKDLSAPDQMQQAML